MKTTIGQTLECLECRERFSWRDDGLPSRLCPKCGSKRVTFAKFICRKCKYWLTYNNFREHFGVCPKCGSQDFYSKGPTTVLDRAGNWAFTGYFTLYWGSIAVLALAALLYTLASLVGLAE